MSKGTLHWNDWFRSNGARRNMPLVDFAGVPYDAIFIDGMRAIEREIPSGRLFLEVEKLIAANIPVGFSRRDAERLLYYGQFSFGDGTTLGRLEFQGPDLPEDKDNWGAVQKGSTRIRINYRNLINFANTNPSIFPKNNRGVRRLAILSGSVAIHEVMHVEGFHHGADRPQGADNTPSHPYNRTLNAIAGQALGNIYFSDFIFLQGHAVLPNIVCGTVESHAAFSSYLEFEHSEEPLFDSEFEFYEKQEAKNK